MSVYFYSWCLHILLCLHVVLSDMHFPGKADGSGKMHVTLCDLIMPWESTSATQKKSLSQRYQMGCDCKVINITARCDTEKPLYFSWVWNKLPQVFTLSTWLCFITMAYFRFHSLGLFSAKQREIYPAVLNLNYLKQEGVVPLIAHNSISLWLTLRTVYFCCDQITRCVAFPCEISSPEECLWTDWVTEKLIHGRQSEHYSCIKRGDGSCAWYRGSAPPKKEFLDNEDP